MTNAPTAPTARDVLTQVEAVARASRVSDVNYELQIDLARGRGSYHATVAARFAASLLPQGDQHRHLEDRNFSFFPGSRVLDYTACRIYSANGGMVFVPETRSLR